MFRNCLKVPDPIYQISGIIYQEYDPIYKVFNTIYLVFRSYLYSKQYTVLKVISSIYQ